MLTAQYVQMFSGESHNTVFFIVGPIQCLANIFMISNVGGLQMMVDYKSLSTCYFYCKVTLSNTKYL